MARVFDAPIITNDQSIERLLSAPLPVLILFWREDIPETVNQEMKRIAEQEAGDLIVAKVNTHDNPEAASRFDAHRLTLVGVRDGKEITRAVAPDASEIPAYAAYLLGRGEKPAQREPAHSAKVHNGADSRPVAVTDASFDEMVLHSPLPTLVDFWAPWCGPCHAVAPVLDKLARENAGRLRVAKVNVDQNTHYAGMYGVQGIPTLLLVKNGKVVDRIVGAMPEPSLRGRVEHFLNS